MRKSSRSEISVIQDKIWELCKKIIRYRDGSTCYTCGATGLMGSNQQTGHFIPDSVSGAYLRYDLRNLAVQCLVCNTHRGGMGAEFYRRKLADMGQKWVDDLFADKNLSVKAIDRYREQYITYLVISNNLQKIPKKILFSNLETLNEYILQNSLE